MAPKVLVAGAIHGQLRKAFEMIAKLHRKNDFAFAVVVGDLFGQGVENGLREDLADLLKGQLNVPLPTYFSLGDHSLPADVVAALDASDTNEVVSNLIYLGRKGTLKTSDGIRLVILGGRLVQTDAPVTQAIGKYDPLYLDGDAKGLYGAHSADILITNQWPKGIERISQQQLPEQLLSDQGNQVVSDLCSTLKPRYHFSSSPDAAWIREPFVHPLPYDSLDSAVITRFTSLASIARPAKEWMSAFNLDPTSPPPPAPDATPSPLPERLLPGSRKRQAEDVDSYSRFSNGGGGYRESRGPKRSRGGRRDQRDECFLCVNGNEFQAHMLVSIGNESIVTIPKGPLPLASTFPQLPWSGHVMIIPIYHAANELKSGPRSPDEINQEFVEMARYRQAFHKLIQSKGAGKLGAVCWEVSRTGIRHHHWQLVAAPVDLVKKGLVEAGYRALAQKSNFPSFQTCSPQSRLEQKSDYFRLWIWTPHEKSADPLKAADEAQSEQGEEGTEKSLYFPLPPDQKFNIWFGREVMARLLQLDNRINWLDAEQGMESETKDADALKEAFGEFDFAMQGDTA